jgi:hypothetical protein
MENQLDVSDRINARVAVNRWIDASDDLKHAQENFDSACRDVRDLVKDGGTFVYNDPYSGAAYILRRSHDSFDIQKVEQL